MTHQTTSLGRLSPGTSELREEIPEMDKKKLRIGKGNHNARLFPRMWDA
jgi:hypothetical protein